MFSIYSVCHVVYCSLVTSLLAHGADVHVKVDELHNIFLKRNCHLTCCRSTSFISVAVCYYCSRN
jgi:hypothetical protein